MSLEPTFIYTHDEAPALATYSFLPIIQAFTRHGVKVETRDISPQVVFSQHSMIV